MQMKVVFVAGPYRAPSEWQINQNIRRAEALALDLWRMGLAVLCPHKNTEHYGGAAPDSLWLDGAVEMLRRCDAVVCVQGWESSEGARGEVEQATVSGIPVFYDVSEVAAWLQSLE